MSAKKKDTWSSLASFLGIGGATEPEAETPESPAVAEAAEPAPAAKPAPSIAVEVAATNAAVELKVTDLLNNASAQAAEASPPSASAAAPKKRDRWDSLLGQLGLAAPVTEPLAPEPQPEPPPKFTSKKNVSRTPFLKTPPPREPVAKTPPMPISPPSESMESQANLEGDNAEGPPGYQGPDLLQRLEEERETERKKQNLHRGSFDKLFQSGSRQDDNDNYDDELNSGLKALWEDHDTSTLARGTTAKEEPKREEFRRDEPRREEPRRERSRRDEYRDEMRDLLQDKPGSETQKRNELLASAKEAVRETLGEREPEEDAEQPRKRRRRRRGRRRGGQDRESTDALLSAAGDRAPANEDDDFVDIDPTLDDDLLDSEVADVVETPRGRDEAGRPPRKRRRRRRRPENTPEKVKPVEVEDDFDDEFEGPASLDYMGEDKFDDTHKGIPTWDDAVGAIVTANIEARGSRPSHGAPRSRGDGGRGDGGRGDRGRSDRGPSDRGPNDRGPGDRGPSDHGRGDGGRGGRNEGGRGDGGRGRGR
jgi:hypothetical protein